MVSFSSVELISQISSCSNSCERPIDMQNGRRLPPVLFRTKWVLFCAWRWLWPQFLWTIRTTKLVEKNHRSMPGFLRCETYRLSCYGAPGHTRPNPFPGRHLSYANNRSLSMASFRGRVQWVNKTGAWLSLEAVNKPLQRLLENPSGKSGEWLSSFASCKQTWPVRRLCIPG